MQFVAEFRRMHLAANTPGNPRFSGEPTGTNMHAWLGWVGASGTGSNGHRSATTTYKGRATALGGRSGSSNSSAFSKSRALTASTNARARASFITEGMYTAIGRVLVSPKAKPLDGGAEGL